MEQKTKNTVHTVSRVVIAGTNSGSSRLDAIFVFKGVFEFVDFENG